MKTIVINTSKDALNTKLDLLFKVPFDQNSFIWFDSDLGAPQEIVCNIKQALINESDIVDKDYNLIVLVDLCRFPRANEISVTKLYKALLTKYIGTTIVSKLYEDFNLLPLGVSVYFADPSKIETGFDPSVLVDNPTEQRHTEEAEIVKKESKKSKADKSDDLEDDTFFDSKPDGTGRTPSEKLIMELFSWTEELDKNSFSWKMKASVSEDKYIDFSSTFETVAFSISKSDESVKVLKMALDAINTAISGNWGENNTLDFPIGTDKRRDINCFTFHMITANEQSLIESYFNVFANIFTCVQKRELVKVLRKYEKEEIREMLVGALKKYRYFSNERNIEITPVRFAGIFKLREKIFKEQKKSFRISEKYVGKTLDEIVEIIMKENRAAVSGGTVADDPKLHGIDRDFYKLVAAIFANYDKETIKTQNNAIVKDCIMHLWTWRDSRTSDDFRNIVESVENNEAIEESKDDRIELPFITEEYEEEYNSMINEVTEVEHRLASNKNILMDTKNLVIKYGDLMRKSKWYWVSFIGAVVAVIASVLPFVYIQSYSINENVLHKILYILFTAGFAVLYIFASSIYMNRIYKKKRIIKDELEQLKEQSERERAESIAALYKFYSETIIKTESLNLLWREIKRREKENAKKNVMLNNHKKQIETLAGLVERFITLLKINDDISIYRISEDDEKYFENLGLSLKAEETFYSVDNQKIYSILPDDTWSDGNANTEERR